MLSNLNEKYLLKFISNANTGFDSYDKSLIDILSSFGIKIAFKNENPVYDIIDKLEYFGILYE